MADIRIKVIKSLGPDLTQEYANIKATQVQLLEHLHNGFLVQSSFVLIVVALYFLETQVVHCKELFYLQLDPCCTAFCLNHMLLGC